MITPLHEPKTISVLEFFREHGTLSRTDVIELTGLSRSTVNQRLSELLENGLITSLEGGESTGGRPSSRFAFNASRASVLSIDIGATGFVVAACNLNGEVLADEYQAIEVWQGPQAVLTAVNDKIRDLDHKTEIWAIGIAVPGPVVYSARKVVKPPIMTGWDGFDIVAWFNKSFGSEISIFVENDANVRAVAEAKTRSIDNVISLKLGTGVGAGLFFNGQIIRGDKGAAGDIGHTQAPVSNQDRELCVCGNLGCVEAYAGGWAIMRDLELEGIQVESLKEVVDLVNLGNLAAIKLVRAAGRVIGDAIADLVSILNPSTIVLSGQLSGCGEVLMTGIRERVHQHTVPLSTSDLVMTNSALGSLEGVIGLAMISVESVLKKF